MQLMIYQQTTGSQSGKKISTLGVMGAYVIFSPTKPMELQVQLLIPLCHGTEHNDYK